MNIIASIIWLGTMSAILAALIAINASLPIKFLLGGFFGILYLILYQQSRVQNETEKLLLKLLYFVRCDYIANEMKRLDSKDLRPAKDILCSDAEDEKAMEEIGLKLGGETAWFLTHSTML